MNHEESRHRSTLRKNIDQKQIKHVNVKLKDLNRLRYNNIGKEPCSTNNYEHFTTRHSPIMDKEEPLSENEEPSYKNYKIQTFVIPLIPITLLLTLNINYSFM